MNYSYTFFYTDLFIYLVYTCLIFSLFKTLANFEKRAKWKKVYSTPSKLIACMLVIFFTLITIIDSVHYQKGNQGVYSVLDLILQPMKDNIEDTYSIPFAIKSFSPTYIKTENSTKTSYPRLKYAGNHLKSSEDHKTDISLKLAHTLILAICIFISLGLLLKLMCKQYFFYQQNAFWGTLFGLVLVSVGIIKISPFYHILGTNKIGEDVCYSIIKSIRTGFVIGSVTTLFQVPFALLFGTIAGYYRGAWDNGIQFLYTLINCVPGVLLIAATILLLQVKLDTQASVHIINDKADLRLLLICMVLGITSWPGLCRLLRAETLKITTTTFVAAAKVLGTKDKGIIWRHIIPNLSHIIFIAVTLEFSSLVLAESVLSYVGVGLDSATYSWGNIINSARLELAREPIIWWPLLGVFLVMTTFVLAANIFADGIREIYDPKFE